ncbi:aarF domain-containing protein kinase 1 isoform X2 [Pseudopipra pipra]|uniref:aarF domain-containing protein kinase 1 isoform X2 n=1 Tax=Pseudopipra pipra TaxID=415032 RepID=UPI003139467A
MARRALKLASLTAAASGIYMYGNKFLDPNDFGIVRVGRAIATTAVITYDYLTSLRSVPYGTEEYEFLKSQLPKKYTVARGVSEEYPTRCSEETIRKPLKNALLQGICIIRNIIKGQMGSGEIIMFYLMFGRRLESQCEINKNEYSAVQSEEVHLRSAERLRELCCSNRGTFIKVGQHLGALDYLLPEEYTRTLKVLHSQAPQSTRQEIEQVIREDLGKEVLLLVVKQIFPDFEFMWLVEEAKKNLPLELDFLHEGRNAEKVAYMLKNFDFLKVPRIYWELSTRRVLLMEFMEGGQVNDRAYMERNGINVNEISRNLGKLYSEMIFVNGFVHCDPHPGNVLVKKCPTSGKAHIILLDHGLYQVLSESFRMDYCRLWQALIKADMKRVQKYSRRLGAGDLYPLFACMLTARSWESVNRGIDQSPVSASEDMEIRSNAAAYLPQITQLLNNVPRQMLLLLKTNDLLRGIESALHTRASASSFLNMSRCCIRAVSTYQRSKSLSLYRRAQISLTEALSLWQINLYELFLWLKGSQLGNWVIALLRRMHHSTY